MILLSTESTLALQRSAQRACHESSHVPVVAMLMGFIGCCKTTSACWDTFLYTMRLSCPNDNIIIQLAKYVNVIFINRTKPLLL